MPVTAGVLGIVAGVLSLFTGLLVSTILSAIGSIVGIPQAGGHGHPSCRLRHRCGGRRIVRHTAESVADGPDRRNLRVDVATYPPWDTIDNLRICRKERA